MQADPFKAFVTKGRTRLRWMARDLLQTAFPRPRDIACALCGHRDQAVAFKEYRTACIFQGGRLTRYGCPSCGVIFGPQKFLALSPDQVAREYRELYSVYSEGDPTESEAEAFRALRPRPGGVYLNYGCGDAYGSIESIRKQGYDLRGFEPYAGVARQPDFVISDISELRAMRFDGILTHNVLEHLFRPIETLMLLRDLLQEGAMLVNKTPCYDYCYEYTRFHVFFFTGRSVQYMCDQAQMRYEDTSDKATKLFMKRAY